jgi:hypothetical protein
VRVDGLVLGELDRDHCRHAGAGRRHRRLSGEGERRSVDTEGSDPGGGTAYRDRTGTRAMPLLDYRSRRPDPRGRWRNVDRRPYA